MSVVPFESPNLAGIMRRPMLSTDVPRTAAEREIIRKHDDARRQTYEESRRLLHLAGIPSCLENTQIEIRKPLPGLQYPSDLSLADFYLWFKRNQMHMRPQDIRLVIKLLSGGFVEFLATTVIDYLKWDEANGLLYDAVDVAVRNKRPLGFLLHCFVTDCIATTQRRPWSVALNTLSCIPPLVMENIRRYPELQMFTPIWQKFIGPVLRSINESKRFDTLVWSSPSFEGDGMGDVNAVIDLLHFMNATLTGEPLVQLTCVRIYLSPIHFLILFSA